VKKERVTASEAKRKVLLCVDIPLRSSRRLDEV
jgi:hypothetical protein